MTITVSSNLRHFCAGFPAADNEYVTSADNIVESTSHRNTILTLADFKSTHRTNTGDLYLNLMHHNASQILILPFNAHSLSNKRTH